MSREDVASGLRVHMSSQGLVLGLRVPQFRRGVDLDLKGLWVRLVQDSMAVIRPDLMVNLVSYPFCEDLMDYMDSLAQDLKGHLVNRHLLGLMDHLVSSHDLIHQYLKGLMVLNTSQLQGLLCPLAFKVQGLKM